MIGKDALDEINKKYQTDLGDQKSIVKTPEVVISDIRMPFLSMVVFMVKWAIVSIPAIIILWMLFVTFGGVLTGLTNI